VYAIWQRKKRKLRKKEGDNLSNAKTPRSLFPALRETKGAGFLIYPDYSGLE